MDKHEEISERLRKLVDEKFPGRGGRRKAAAALGYREAYLSLVLRAKVQSEISTYRRFADGLGVPLEEILGITPTEPTVDTPPAADLPIIRPIRGTVSAGKGIDRAADRGETMEVPFRMRHADSLYRVLGTSMVAAGIDDGDIIGVRYAPNAEHGEIVVAWLADREVCVVKMLENRVDGLAYLRGVNGKYQKPYKIQEGDTILGTFVGKMRPPEDERKKAKGKK